MNVLPDWLRGTLEGYDPLKLTVAALGSHSALDICRGAKHAGFRSLVVSQRGRERPYSEFFRTRLEGARSIGCVDECLILDAFADVLQLEVQRQLVERNSVFVPHRSFEVYLDSDYDAIETSFRVPMFGNRYLLRIEERGASPNQYDLLHEAGIRTPRLYRKPEDIDHLAIVKVLEAERGFERAFFLVRDAADYRNHAERKLVQGVVTESGLAGATIEEFVLGVPINFNFFYSPLHERLELMGTDARRQTNVTGLSTLPARLHDDALAGVSLRYEEAGHVAVTVLESMLGPIMEAGEAFAAAAARLYPPGVIGPFALQAIITPGPPRKDFVVVDVSPRVPGSPGIAATPYTNYLFGEPVSVGHRLAWELRDAVAASALQAVIT